MSRKVILITDLHISTGNKPVLIDLFHQIIDDNKKIGSKVVIIIGDLFIWRKAQPLECLIAFIDLMDILISNGMDVHVISGNHDKVDPDDTRSYLSIYKNYHENLYIYDDYDMFIYDGVYYHMIPYFEKGYIERLENASSIAQEATGVVYNVLCTHISIEGWLPSHRQGENTIKKELFKNFNLVLVGHNHNRKGIGNNIRYIGSMMPVNFGEDNDKGYTVIYNDSDKLVVVHKKLKFIEYITEYVRYEKLNQDKLRKIIEKHSNADYNIRVVVDGDARVLDTIDISMFTSVGIVLELRRRGTTNNDSIDDIESVRFDQGNIMETLDEFCAEMKIPDNTMKTYMKKLINI